MPSGIKNMYYIFDIISIEYEKSNHTTSKKIEWKTSSGEVEYTSKEI